MSLMDQPNRQVLGLEPMRTGDNSGDVAEPKAAKAAAKEKPELDVDSLTKAELLELARELGVQPANNDMTKEELRAGVDEKLGEAD